MKNNRVSSRRGDPRRHHLRDTLTTTTTTTRLLFAATVSTCLLSVVTAQGTDLGGGIVARTNVQQYANLATDVRDIQQLLAEGGASSSPEALNIYQQGRNADLRPGVKLSLQSLTTSLDPTSTSSSTPAYLTHLFGLADQDTTALSDHTLYADDYVRTQLSSGTAQSTDAIVALQMWMYGTHLLFTGIDTCRKMIAADNPSIFDLGGGGMDEFIALWIGEGQRPGNKNNDGHALYAMTQRAADLYSLAEPEAPANSNIKLLYNEGASALSFPNACTKENDETLGQLWSVAQRIVSQMTVPLMQLLIDALVTRDTEATRLYALAVVPQMAQCRPSTYKRLQERLLDGTATINRVDEIIRDIQSMTDCLGFQCSDLGVHKGGEVPGCQDVSPITPLAEYTPTTAVHPVRTIQYNTVQCSLIHMLFMCVLARACQHAMCFTGMVLLVLYLTLIGCLSLPSLLSSSHLSSLHVYIDIHTHIQTQITQTQTIHSTPRLTWTCCRLNNSLPCSPMNSPRCSISTAKTPPSNTRMTAYTNSGHSTTLPPTTTAHWPIHSTQTLNGTTTTPTTPTRSSNRHSTTVASGAARLRWHKGHEWWPTHSPTKYCTCTPW